MIIYALCEPDEPQRNPSPFSMLFLLRRIKGVGLGMRLVNPFVHQIGEENCRHDNDLLLLQNLLRIVFIGVITHHILLFTTADMYSHMHTSFYNVIHNMHSHRKHVASIVYSPKMQPSNSNPLTLAVPRPSY